MEQKNTEMTLEEAKAAILQAKKQKEFEEEKLSLFGILWVVLGALFAVLFDNILTGGLTGLVCAAVYAFVIHGRK